MADARNRHQPSAGIGSPGQPLDVGIDRCNSREHGSTRRDEAAHGGRQTGDSLTCLQRLRDECRAQRPRQADAEYHGKAPDLVLQHDPLADQLLAGDEQRANGVRRQRLHVHELEEAGAGEMRQATRSVAVGLVGPPICFIQACNGAGSPKTSFARIS